MSDEWTCPDCGFTVRTPAEQAAARGCPTCQPEPAPNKPSPMGARGNYVVGGHRPPKPPQPETGLSGYLDGRPEPDESDQRYEDALTEPEPTPTHDPSPDRVERVAKAIHDTYRGAVPWEQANEFRQRKSRIQARAAMAALQPDPDEVVVTLTLEEAEQAIRSIMTAGLTLTEPSCHNAEAYGARDKIRAALNEKGDDR